MTQAIKFLEQNVVNEITTNNPANTSQAMPRRWYIVVNGTLLQRSSIECIHLFHQDRNKSRPNRQRSETTPRGR